jgi:PIN domain-containing protein
MSKKRSAASSGSKLPSPHTFFIDRSLGQKIVAQALRAAGATVVIHDDLFRSDAPDEEWLRVVGQFGWIVLTRDKMIRYRDAERAAIIRSGVRAFVLRGKSLRGPEMGQAFVTALPAMVRFLAKRRSPFVATLTSKGTISGVLEL